MERSTETSLRIRIPNTRPSFAKLLRICGLRRRLFDELVQLVAAKGNSDTSTIEERLGITREEMGDCLLSLERLGLIEVHVERGEQHG